jgi:hypothetical protein
LPAAVTITEGAVDANLVGAEYKGAYKAAIDAVCVAVDWSVQKAGHSQAVADATLLHLAKQIKMKPSGRAALFIGHFIAGRGEDITFNSATLLNEDPGVRRRVSTQIVERLRKNPGLSDKRMSGGDFVVSIRQRDYVIDDWQLALGSFAFEWEVVNKSGDKKRTFARVWGANEYKWHPAAARVTQCLHQAGDRLTRSEEIKSKNFWMVATPTVIVISTGQPVPD